MKYFLSFLSVITAILLLTISRPDVKAQTTSCSLSGGDDTTVLLFSGQGIRSDQAETDAFVSLSASVPAGTYEITLQSYDDHSGVPEEQPNERWFLQLKRANGDIIASTQSISDLPTDESSLVEVVETGFDLAETAVSITAMHAVYPDGTSPNSIEPICASFRLIVDDPGPGSDDDGNADDNPVARPPRLPYCTRFDFEMGEDQVTGAYPGTFRMLERGTGNLLASWEVSGSDMTQPTRNLDSGEKTDIYPNFYPSTHVSVVFTSSNPEWVDDVTMDIINHAPAPDEAYGSLTADRCDAIEIQYPPDFPPATETAVSSGQTGPVTQSTPSTVSDGTSKQPTGTSMAKKPDSKCETAVTTWQVEAAEHYDVAFSGDMEIVASTPFYDDVKMHTDDGVTIVRVLKGVSMSTVLSGFEN